MIIIYRSGWIFLSHPHIIIGFFFLLTITYCIFILFQKFLNTLSFDITGWHHFNIKMTSLEYLRMAVLFYPFHALVGGGMWDRLFSYREISRNLDLVCKNSSLVYKIVPIVWVSFLILFYAKHNAVFGMYCVLIIWRTNKRNMVLLGMKIL